MRREEAAPRAHGGRVEVELKYSAAGEAFTRLAQVEALGPLRLGATHGYDELDRYLDTGDGRLAAAGWACRLRHREREYLVSLKGPAEGGGGALHRRPEVEGPATDGLDPRDWPDSPARAFLAQLAGGLAPLVERLRLRQRRVEREALLDDRAVGVLSLDEAVVLAAGEELATLRDVELELGAEVEHLAAQVDAALAAVPGLLAQPASKLARALALMENDDARRTV